MSAAVTQHNWLMNNPALAPASNVVKDLGNVFEQELPETLAASYWIETGTGEARLLINAQVLCPI